MKKILICVLALILISWGVWAARRQSETTPSQNATSTPSEVTLRSFSDPDGIFTFKYPAAFMATGRESASSSTTGWSNFSQRPGMVFARVKVPREYLPNTNFSEAWLTIGWSNDAEAIRTCSVVKNDSFPEAEPSKVEVSGYPFSKGYMSDAAAGNRYDTTAYRGLLDGDCYSLEYTIHYGNIQNYDASSGIKEFDEAKLAAELDSIVKSFVFNVNSD